jgi:hypothetical protein
MFLIRANIQRDKRGASEETDGLYCLKDKMMKRAAAKMEMLQIIYSSVTPVHNIITCVCFTRMWLLSLLECDVCAAGQAVTTVYSFILIRLSADACSLLGAHVMLSK